MEKCISDVKDQCKENDNHGDNNNECGEKGYKKDVINDCLQTIIRENDDKGPNDSVSNVGGKTYLSAGCFK